MTLRLAGAGLALLLAGAAHAQAMDHAMPGMDHGAMTMPMPMPMPMPTPNSMPMPEPAPAPHASHEAAAPPAAPADAPAVATGTDLPAGKAPPPLPPLDHYADRIFAPVEMASARAQLHAEHGGGDFHQVLFNLAERQFGKGRDGYRWDGEAWFGGDLDRVMLKTEGEGRDGGGVDSAELQALYSRALDPYWNLHAGVRHDFARGPQRSYATLGVEGLAPYMIEVEAALFLSQKGDLLARIEGWYDQRLTQRLVLQPRAELNFAAQDVAANRYGAGLVDAELGLRLRYEITREFAPYVGVSWEKRAGASARYARAREDDADATTFVAGIRTWF